MNAEPADSEIRPGLVVVLAAGAGTRMKSDLAKVLHPILGRPLLGHVLAAVLDTKPLHVVVVVGHQREQVVEYVNRDFPQVLTAVQDEQNGTGHAVRCALDALAADGIDLGDEPVMVVAGDTPLLTPATLTDLVSTHVAT